MSLGGTLPTIRCHDQLVNRILEFTASIPSWGSSQIVEEAVERQTGIVVHGPIGELWDGGPYRWVPNRPQEGLLSAPPGRAA